MYQTALKNLGAALGGNSATTGGGIGAPPAAQPDIAPAPYDVAHDPAWKGLMHPGDHEFRNFLNGLDADQREMLRKKISTPGGFAAPTPPPMTSPLPAAPAQPAQGPM